MNTDFRQYRILIRILKVQIEHPALKLLVSIEKIVCLFHLTGDIEKKLLFWRVHYTNFCIFLTLKSCAFMSSNILNITAKPVPETKVKLTYPTIYKEGLILKYKNKS
ncbi:hypothetical protein HUJ04_012518 [Dendroctonus ponderosae]|nr:hypothetical protein HUJ04_012518 [Dendroctonus ponderosae]